MLGEVLLDSLKQEPRLFPSLVQSVLGGGGGGALISHGPPGNTRQRWRRPLGGGSSLCAKGTASVCLVLPSWLLASCDGAGPLELSRRLFSDGPCAPTTPPHAYSHHRPARPLHLHRCCCLCTRLFPPVFTDKHLCAPCLSLSSSKAAIPSPSIRGSPLSFPLVLPSLLQPPRV